MVEEADETDRMSIEAGTAVLGTSEGLRPWWEVEAGAEGKDDSTGYKPSVFWRRCRRLAVLVVRDLE